MTRLKNQEKAGYFPIPLEVTSLIEKYISAPDGGRILDPCAGEGVALHSLSQGLGLNAYGVELAEDRARMAQVWASNHILHDDYRNLKATKSAFNLLFVNPPYMFAADGDKEAGRAEYQWLVNTRPFLMPGGLLVYVVPHKMLAHRKTVRYLASWYDDVQVKKFPDEILSSIQTGSRLRRA